MFIWLVWLQLLTRVMSHSILHVPIVNFQVRLPSNIQGNTIRSIDCFLPFFFFGWLLLPALRYFLLEAGETVISSGGESFCSSLANSNRFLKWKKKMSYFFCLIINSYQSFDMTEIRSRYTPDENQSCGGPVLSPNIFLVGILLWKRKKKSLMSCAFSVCQNSN